MNEIQPSRNRSLFEEIFLSPGERRLRAGWRLLFQTVLLFFLGSCLGILFIIGLLSLDPSLLQSLSSLQPEYLLLATILETIVVTASVFLARRFLDKKSIESLGLTLNLQSLIDVLAGIGISLLQMGFVFAVMSWLGWILFKGFAWQFDPIGIVVKNTFLFFVIFIFVGWNEELLSRGYHLQTIASGLNLFWGVVISSAVFGLLHLGNPNATWVSAAGIFFAGLFLAYGYVRTRKLWLSIGLHIGWNFFEGVVFGFPVSGLDIYPLTRIQVQGPVAWTGGAFGPEAGLIALPALALGVLLIFLYTRKRVE